MAAVIVQISDFKGEINIANKEQSYVAQTLQPFLDKYESDYLTRLLGPDLYDLFIAAIIAGSPAQKWVDLKNKIGLAIADNVYWYYIKDQNTQTVGIGQVKTEGQNAVVVSPYLKMLRAWNEMVNLGLNTVKFIIANPDDYGDYYISNFFSCYNPTPQDEIFYSINEFEL